MIVGIGVDVVDIERFDAVISRRPAIIERLFTEAETRDRDGRVRSARSLAARFAAKEAVSKALGGPPGLRWHDCEIVSGITGRPLLEVRASVAAAARARGIDRWHLSLTHDGGIALAYVIGETDPDAVIDEAEPMRRGQ